MAEVNRKSVSSLIRAYGEVNPDAVVRLMQQYQNMEESRAKEETEEIMMNAEVLGNLGGGVIGNLSDFRTAKAGGYEKGYFKFLIEKPENISSFMDDGKNRIDNATGREKELLTALFPKAKQKHVSLQHTVHIALLTHTSTTGRRVSRDVSPTVASATSKLAGLCFD